MARYNDRLTVRAHSYAMKPSVPGDQTSSLKPRSTAIPADVNFGS